MNISTAHQHDTNLTDRRLTLENTEVQTTSITFMVKHNIRESQRDNCTSQMVYQFHTPLR